MKSKMLGLKQIEQIPNSTIREKNLKKMICWKLSIKQNGSGLDMWHV